MNLEDEELALLVVAGRFVLPRPRTRPSLDLADDQVPVPLADEYNGEVGSSSLRWEGQSNCLRPGADVYVAATAWAPGGRPVAVSSVAIQLDRCRQTAVVFGDRVWADTWNGLQPSPPRPFECIPLVYERSFGGVLAGASGAAADVSARNPVGRGLYHRDDALDRPLPNVEDPERLVTALGDRPVPRGFGPIARGWLPRRALAGSYDVEWVRSRAPLWPRDVDRRFFSGASPGLWSSSPFVGGEVGILEGVHPDGAIQFQLPRCPLLATFSFTNRRTVLSPVVDAVFIDADAARVTLIWRAAVAVRPSLLALREVVLRPAERWERSS